MDTSSSDFQSLTWSSKSQNRTQTAFLRVLIQGRGTLFLFKENKRRHFFMEEDTLKVTELLSKDYLEAINMVANKTQYKGQLKYYWRNYPSLTAQINRLNYDEKSLMNLFENYEKLHGGQPYIEQANKGLDVKFQVVGGLSLTKLAFKSNLALSNIEKADFNNTLSPVLGFAVELMPFKQGETRKINRISFYNEILYKKFVSEGIATKYFTDQIESIDIYKLGFSYLRLSTAVRYQSTGENFKYFASLGFTGALLLKTYNNSHIYRYYTFNTTNFIEKQDESIAYLSKYEIGYLGSLGLKYRQFSLEMRYESSTGMSQKTLIINPIVSQFHFLLGYRFGKTKS